jgi:hypothetical protein
MRNCKQKNCTFLQLGAGCRRCSFCSASPFLIADDCPTCWECENVPGACRWGDENPKETNKEEEKEKEEEKAMEIIA